jgi:hypothetical protein
MIPRQLERDHLPEGMHPCICPSSTQKDPFLPAKLPERSFDHTLHGAGSLASRLPLESLEMGSIVGENNLVTCHA